VVYTGEDEEFEAPSFRGLHFSTFLINGGSFPLEIKGTLREDDPANARAEQCVAFTDAGVCEAFQPAGSLHFYPLDYTPEDPLFPENCYSLEGIVRYELRAIAGGAPDMSPGGLKTQNVADHSLEDEQPSGDHDTEGVLPTYSTCAGFVRQGISPGYMERRFPDDRGQYLDLAGRHGDFALVMVADPFDRIHESNEQDNITYRLIRVINDTVTPIEQ
jgi:hypothetical protein